MSQVKKSFRLVCDKSCTNPILQAEWSPTRDLIALVTTNGDVRLHRLYWQRVWVKPSKDKSVTRVAWKPDGQLLVVGHTDGTVVLLEIEKATVLHSFSCGSRITSLHWSMVQSDQYFDYGDFCRKFTPLLKRDNLKEMMKSFDFLISSNKTEHSMLVVGNDLGELYIFAEGIFLVFHLCHRNFGLNTSSILSCHLSIKDGILSVISSGKTDENENVPKHVYLTRFTSDLLKANTAELFCLAERFSRIEMLTRKCEKILKQMTEASEDVCIRINSKLEKLENLVSQTDSSVASAFTIAFATGEISPELQTFFTQHLKSKELKQISQSVRLSYLSLHNDISEELEPLLQHMMAYFVEINGMLEMPVEFVMLQSSETSVKKCIEYLQKFFLKIYFLLRVIDNDMKNFNVFFTWLINLLFRVTGEESSASLKTLTNDDFDVMLEFLEFRLLKVEKTNGIGYSLEQVNQFFQLQSLDFPEKTNSWNEFVNQNKMLKENSLIIKPDPNATLIYLFQCFRDSFMELTNDVRAKNSSSFSVNSSLNLYEVQGDHEEHCESHFSFIKTTEALMLSIVACSCDSDRFFLMSLKPNGSVYLGGLCLEMDSTTQITIRDCIFYNDNFVSILYDEQNQQYEPNGSVFAQVQLGRVLPSCNKHLVAEDMNKGVLDTVLDLPWINIKEFITEQRSLEGFEGKYLCVNGLSRNVSCLISMSRRRVRIFDMTAEDEEGDTTLSNE